MNKQQVDLFTRTRHKWLLNAIEEGRIELDPYWKGYINGLEYVLKLMDHQSNKRPPNLNTQD